MKQFAARLSLCPNSKRRKTVEREKALKAAFFLLARSQQSLFLSRSLTAGERSLFSERGEEKKQQGVTYADGPKTTMHPREREIETGMEMGLVECMTNCCSSSRQPLKRRKKVEILGLASFPPKFVKVWQMRGKNRKVRMRKVTGCIFWWLVEAACGENIFLFSCQCLYFYRSRMLKIFHNFLDSYMDQESEPKE